MSDKQERDRSPAGRFTYLSMKRMDKAVSAIESLSNLSDKKNYEYTDDQVKQITYALEDAVAELRSKFQTNSRPSAKGFKFK